MYQAHIFRESGMQFKFGKSLAGSLNYSCYSRCVYFKGVYQCSPYSGKCFFPFTTISIQHQKHLHPPNKDSIKLSLSQLRSLSTLWHNLGHRDFDYLIIPHDCKLIYFTLMELGEQKEAGIPDVLVRYKHARSGK